MGWSSHGAKRSPKARSNIDCRPFSRSGRTRRPTCGSVRIDRLDPWLGPTKRGTGDCPDEVTLSRKEAKSRRRITGLRSKTTKARTHVDRLRAANADLTKKLAEAREQQTATSDVLKVISRSTFDLQTVLDTLVESATRLCNADHAWLFQREGEFFRWVTSFGHAAEVRARLRDYFKPLKVPVDRGSITGRAALEGRVVHVPDVLADPDYTWMGAQEIGGYRAALGAPLLRKGDVVGVIFVAKTAPQPFTAKQIELVTTFADQAVIAIENTRLLNELNESLQQQTATADVLKVISRSAFDLQTVLDTLVESAVRLCEARFGAVFRLDHGLLHLAAQHNFDEDLGWVALIQGRYPMAPNRGHISGRAILKGGPVQIPDILADHEYQGRGTKDAGFRSLLGVPLLREGGAIGAIVIYRKEPGAFTDKQLALLQTFADQAEIAIENAWLLVELRQRTTDLSKALDQQTATSEVLQSISSSSGELEPVFLAILAHATRLCEAKFGSLYLRKEDAFRAVAMHGPSPIVEWLQRERVVELRDHPHIPLARVTQSKEVLHIRDLAADQAYIERDPRIVAVVELGGYRTVLWVPMLKEGELIGVIVIYRLEVRPFSDKQIELVQNFANQAVIAIENTRLLNELRRSLQQQTATADVLKVISRSTFDLKTVLQTLVESAARLCEADQATITRQIGGKFFRAEAYGFSSEFMNYVKDVPVELERGTVPGRALLEGQIIHIPDVLADPDYTWAQAQRLGGFRTILGVPMLREGVPIGVLALTRSEVRPFTDKQVELVTTFADQAAIAIENARLFEQEATARTAAEAANLAKSTFLATMSHEI